MFISTFTLLPHIMARWRMCGTSFITHSNLLIPILLLILVFGHRIMFLVIHSWFVYFLFSARALYLSYIMQFYVVDLHVNNRHTSSNNQRSAQGEGYPMVPSQARTGWDTPRKGTGEEYLILGGQYAFCVHTEGLSCYLQSRKED